MALTTHELYRLKGNVYLLGKLLHQAFKMRI